jgi:hypothetical protein
LRSPPLLPFVLSPSLSVLLAGMLSLPPPSYFVVAVAAHAVVGQVHAVAAAALVIHVAVVHR